MLTSLAMLVLAVSPGKMALFSVDGAGFTSDERTAWAEQTEKALIAKHYDVVAARAMPPGLLGQAKSCGANLDCLGAVAEAVGAESLLVVKASRTGERVLIEIRVYDTKGAWARATSRAEAASIAEVPATLDAAVTALVVQFEVSAEPAPAPAPRGLGVGFWAPVVSGLVVMGAGGYTLGTALADLDAARKAREVALTPEEADEAGRRVSRDIAQRNLGIVGMCFGAASILAGVIVTLTSPAPAPPPVSVGAMISPSGGAVQVSGSF